jgi:SAM-dependent methyltransferase
MSATGRGGERHERDFYETPLDVAQKALSMLPEDLSGPMYQSYARILDVGAGTGVWGKAALKRWPNAHVEGIDLTPQSSQHCRYDVWHQRDFLTADLGKFDAVIGNPPYNQAEQFVLHGLQHLQRGGSLLLLLRLGFLEGKGRMSRIWSKHPPSDVAVLSRRVSFTGDGRTDATAYGIFRWQEGHVGPFRGTWI